MLAYNSHGLKDVYNVHTLNLKVTAACTWSLLPDGCCAWPWYSLFALTLFDPGF